MTLSQTTAYHTPNTAPNCSTISSLPGFPGGLDGKKSSCTAGDLGSIPGLGRFHGGGHGNALQYSWLENPHGQRSLAGYSLWGSEESNATERLSTAHPPTYKHQGNNAGVLSINALYTPVGTVQLDGCTAIHCQLGIRVFIQLSYTQQVLSIWWEKHQVLAISS